MRQAIFLDRDGTINREVNYLSHPDQFELLPGVAETIAGWNTDGWVVVVVTNQSGVGRGYFSAETLDAINERMLRELAVRSARVDAIYTCTHRPDEECACRKPRIGLFRRAADDLGIDVGKSYFVGDKWSDVLPAIELGGRGVLVLTGHGEAQIGSAPPMNASLIAQAADLREALRITRIEAPEVR